MDARERASSVDELLEEEEPSRLERPRWYLK
jgi:hypothetical protein